MLSSSSRLVVVSEAIKYVLWTILIHVIRHVMTLLVADDVTWDSN